MNITKRKSNHIKKVLKKYFTKKVLKRFCIRVCLSLPYAIHRVVMRETPNLVAPKAKPAGSIHNPYSSYIEQGY